MSDGIINNNNDEVIILTDTEIKERKKRRSKQENDNFANEPIISKEDIAEGNLCEIVFETEGRFDIPKKLSFNPFSTLDINNIVLTKQEKILDVTIDTLNNLKEEKDSCDLANMLMEEFLELVVGMKLRFISRMHEHKWLCDCQYDLDEQDQKVNTSEIDLQTLQYSPISDADEKLREFFKLFVDKMEEEEFSSWKNTTFENKLDQDEIDSLTREGALSKVQIEEPIALSDKKHTYRFRFNRVGDLIIARKMAEAQFAPKFKQIQNLRYDSKKETTIEYQNRKREMTEEIKEEKAKYAIHIANAMRLVSIDGVTYKNNYERAEAYGKIATNVTQNLVNFLDSLTFGVNDTRSFVCPLCGETKKRYLRRTFNPMEFLPVDVSTEGERKLDSGFTISFGV